MKPPIIVDYEGDLLCFGSVAEAESYVEAEDIGSGACVAFDSEGLLLQGKVEEPTPYRYRVVLCPAEERPAHAEALRSRLLKALASAGLPRRELDGTSLAELVQQAQVRFRLP